MQTGIARLKKRVCMADGVDNNIRWSVGIVHLLQGGVEPFDEAEIHLLARAVQREVEARRTNEVEVGVVVPGADDSTNGNIRNV